MACMCGDIHCPSCGPAQGNNRCSACGNWADDGGCDDPVACAEKNKELDRQYFLTEAECELESAAAEGRQPLAWAVEAMSKSKMTEAEKIEKLRAALTAITKVAGNLPDERITSRTGANDAVQRGLMVVQAREIARKALSETV